MNHATFYSLQPLLFCLVILTLLSAPQAAAQLPSDDDCAAGRHFIIGLPDTVTNSFDGRFPPVHDEKAFLMIYSATTQDVRIGAPGGTTVTQPLVAGEMIEFDMARVRFPFITVANARSTSLLNVEADDPIIVYAYVTSHFGCAAFTPIPVERWGTEYVAATWPGSFVRNVIPDGETHYDATQKRPTPAEIVIIAAYDNTTVRIEPTDSLLNCVNCTTVTLQAREAYLVQSYVDTNEGVAHQPDLAGTRITADRPIGVMSGNTRTAIEESPALMLAGNSIKDLAVEWLRPVSSQGTMFVAMPVMDDNRPRPNADPVREAEYIRIISSYDDMTTVSAKGRVPEEMVGSPLGLRETLADTIRRFTNAVAFTTSGPAALYQSPKPVAHFNGTTGSGNFIGASYLSWGTFLVEAAPREQWVGFAPFRAPSVQSSMKHYLNLVTDTNNQFNIYFRQGTSPRQNFPFNRGTIAGTDLVWGSISVNPGVSYIIEGDDGARFGGYVYGSWRGYELYRPGGTEGEKGSDPAAAHPSEYEENMAQYYAYPLASRHCALREVDGFRTEESDQGCGVRLVTIRLVGDDALGIGSVSIDRTMQLSNMRMELVTPADSSLLSSGRVTEVVVRLSPIDPSLPAEGTIRYREKGNGLSGQLTYSSNGSSLRVAPSEPLHFGDLSVGISSIDQSVTFTNTSDVDLTITTVRLAGDSSGFRIVRTVPAVDFANGETATLGPDETLRFVIDVTAMSAEGTIRDTIVLEHTCGTIAVPMSGTVEPACLRINDLDFGMVRRGERRTMPLRICNDGPGRATFPDSGEIISWLGSEFGVSAADVARLRGAILDSGECILIDVNFLVTEEFGLFQTTAHIRSNGIGCRDTSIWIARVDTISSVDEWSSISGMAVTPNPASDELTVAFTLERATDLLIVLYDASGRVAASFDAGRLSAGTHRIPLDLPGLPSGMYLMRVSGKGLGERDQRVMILR